MKVVVVATIIMLFAIFIFLQLDDADCKRVKNVATPVQLWYAIIGFLKPEILMTLQ
jgi:hypothetical protein